MKRSSPTDEAGRIDAFHPVCCLAVSAAGSRVLLANATYSLTRYAEWISVQYIPNLTAAAAASILLPHGGGPQLAPSAAAAAAHLLLVLSCCYVTWPSRIDDAHTFVQQHLKSSRSQTLMGCSAAQWRRISDRVCAEREREPLDESSVDADDDAPYNVLNVAPVAARATNSGIPAAALRTALEKEHESSLLYASIGELSAARNSSINKINSRVYACVYYI
ncbi:unnamed protein product [Trichogramma brassicae]|uniref:Uncharacterized protein n=1 Tax=Trichogramma brassicae TaxID=86971 RepID=A0A6H5HYM7_9HYME|nr:unnamed protein product [Trichogramma brassicae]